MIRSCVVGRLQGPDLGIGTVPASLGAADANARQHAASIKVDATVTGMVKAFIGLDLLLARSSPPARGTRRRRTRRRALRRLRRTRPAPRSKTTPTSAVGLR